MTMLSEGMTIPKWAHAPPLNRSSKRTLAKPIAMCLFIIVFSLFGGGWNKKGHEDRAGQASPRLQPSWPPINDYNP